MDSLTYQEFLLKYPYFKSLDPNFNHKLEITTMTITGILESDQYINKEIDNRIPDINYLVILKDHLSNDFINSLITSTDTFTIKPQKRKYHKRCEKKARKIKFDQITIKTDINEIIKDNGEDENITASLSLKIFSSGLFHITGACNISSVFWIFYRLFKLMKDINYCILDFKNITDFNIAMVNCKCFFPCVIDKYILYQDLMDDFRTNNINDKILSIHYDPIRHSAIKVKVKKEHAINDADVLTLLIFAFGKMLITGGNSYNEILYVYRLFYNYLFEHQKCILEFNEEIIKRTFNDNKIFGRIINTDDGDSYIVPYDKMDEELSKHNCEKINKMIEQCDDVEELLDVQQIINKTKSMQKNRKICSERTTYIKRKIGTARVNKKKNKFIVSEEMIKEMMNGGSEEYFNGF